MLARTALPFVHAYLRHVLRADALHAADRISSIYYDTPTLDFYHEKRASYYLKHKVRLRWYGSEPEDGEAPVACFLELKSKVGGTRRKERFPVTVPARLLTRRNLAGPELQAIASGPPGLGRSFDGALVPLLLVRYQRQRFVHAFSGTRVALDTDICCPAVNQQFVHGLPPAFLDVCILEIKGPGQQIPDWMRPIRHHVRRAAFSKYASCLECLLQPAGRRE